MTEFDEQREVQQWGEQFQKLLTGLTPWQRGAVFRTAILGKPLRSERLRGRCEALARFWRESRSAAAARRAAAEDETKKLSTTEKS